MKRFKIIFISIFLVVFECFGKSFESYVHLEKFVGELPERTYFDDEGHLYLRDLGYRLSLYSPHPIIRSRPKNKFVCEKCEYALDDTIQDLIQNFMEGNLKGESFALLLREIRARIDLQFPHNSRFFLKIIENSFQKKAHYTKEIEPYLDNLDNILFQKLPFDFNVKFPVTFRYLENEELSGYGISLLLKREDLRAIRESEKLKKVTMLGIVFSALKQVLRGIIYKYSCHLDVDENRVNARLIHLLSKKGDPRYFDKKQFKRFIFKKEYDQIFMVIEAIESNFPLIITFLKKGLQNKNDRGVSGENKTYVNNQKILTEFLSRIINNIESVVSYPDKIARLARIDDPDIPKPLKCHPFFSVLSKNYVTETMREAIKQTKKPNGSYDTKALEALGDSLKDLSREALDKMDKDIITY